MVYTAIFGGRDRLHEPRAPRDGVDYICMTDDRNLRSDVWHMIYWTPLKTSPRMMARMFKVVPHLVFNYDRSVWIDGSMEPREELVDFFDTFDEAVAVREHGWRTCAYQEAVVCKHRKKDIPGVIDKTVRWLREIDHPVNAGLAASGILFRRHSEEVDAFGEAWWKAICRGTYRDQLTLVPCLQRSGLPYHLFSGEIAEELVIRHPHKRHKRRRHGLPV
jgi:hypothetical protein